LLPVGGGQWWLATSAGILFFDGDWSALDAPPGIPEVHALSRTASAGAIWAATDVGLYVLDGSWTALGVGDGLPSNAVRDVHVDQVGRLWVATPNGLALDDGGWSAFGEPSVTALAADLRGGLWIGSEAGLTRLEGGARTTFTAQDGLVDDRVGAIHVAADGTVYVGSSGARSGLVAGGDGTWTLVPLPPGAGRVYSITSDSQGRLWVGAGYLELSADRESALVDQLGVAWALAGDTWQRWPLPATPVSLAEDAEGVMWAATRTAGVARISDGVTVAPAPFTQDARSVHVDAVGRVWLVTSAGLFWRGEDAWIDAPMPRFSATNEAWSLYEDNLGSVWAGFSDGLARMDASGEWAWFDGFDALLPSGVGAIIQTLDHDLWFAGRDGDGLLRRRTGNAFPQTRLVDPPRGVIGAPLVRLEMLGGDAHTPAESLRFSVRVNRGPWSAPRTGGVEVVTDLSNGVESEIQARAVDRDGRADPTPATTIVLVDSTPPVVEISQPQDGAHVAGVVSVVGSAHDTDFEAYVLELPGLEASESFDPVVDGLLAEWNTKDVDDGEHIIRLVARDTVDGDYDESHVVAREGSVTVDNTEPLVGLAVPSEPSSGRVQLGVVAWDDALDSWSLDHRHADAEGVVEWTPIIERNSPPAATLSWDTSAWDGPRTLRLRAFDLAGNRAQAEQTILLDNPVARPEVTITTPSDGAFVRGEVRIAGTIADGTLALYEVFIERADGTQEWLADDSEQVIDAPIVDWDTESGAYADGPYTIVVTARDQEGSARTTRVPVTVDNSLPAVDLLAPKDDAVLAADEPTEVLATVVDAHAESFIVEYQVGDGSGGSDVWVLIAQGDVVDGTARAVWTPPPSIAEAVVRVRVRDIAQNDSADNPERSGQAPVTIDRSPPTVSIDEPTAGSMVTGAVAVRGMVVDEGELWPSYSVAYRTGSGAWREIHAAGDAAPPGALAVWDTPKIEGAAALRIVAEDQVGRRAEATVDVRVDNVAPTAVISSPTDRTQIAGVVEIIGSAVDEHFSVYSVDWSPGETGVAAEWTSIAAGVTAPVDDGHLATWDAGITAGPVRLRLTVEDAVGHVTVSETVVIVAGALRSDHHAALSTTDETVRLRLPPNTLPGPTSVTLNDAPDVSPFGQPSLRVVRIEPNGTELDPLKPGTLEFRIPAGHAAAVLGVARWDAARASWDYLGGTVDREAGWVRTRVFSLGRYALVAEPANFATPDDGLRLRCQPRAFSPLGGELPHVSYVTFSLREPSPVRVRIYNQAGRLARELADAPLGAGEQSVPWDGQDGMGRILPNGAYVVQVDSGYARERQVVVIWNR